MDTDKKSRQKTEDYNKCFDYLQQLWKGNKKKEFAEKMEQSFQSATNPYKLALVCIKQCQTSNRNKSNGMVVDVLNELKVFVSSNREQYSHCLCENLQSEVFQVVLKQKNPKLMRLLVESFQLEEVKYQFVPYLRKLISQQHFRDVCTLATLLNLQKEFTTKELIIPLLCQDKLYIADEFLESSPLHQREILLFIDDLIGKKQEALHIAGCYNTGNASQGNYRNNKMLSKIAGKLIKKYKWDESHFPNLHRRRSVASLRFLFHKYYSDKGVLPSAFHSLIEDALKETPCLKLDLMNLFCEFGDPVSAIPYVTKLELNINDLPKKIKNAVLSSPSTGTDLLPHTSDSQKVCESDSNDLSYTLSLPGENIIYIDAVEDFEKCMRDISASCVIAVDSEWKPTFGLGQGEQAALLQLATLSHVYLIDVVTLMPDLKNSHWARLGQIFQDPDILKLGYGIRGDFNNLSKLHRDLEKALSDVKNLIDFDKIKPTLLAAKPELFSYSFSSHKGLSDFVYRCFGKPLNKLHQFSNWASRPLSESQKLYAALDARCLVDIYNYLNEKTEELSFDDWKTYGNVQ